MRSLDAYPLIDVDLARRLERAEAGSNAEFVDARARLDPTVGAAWIEAGGAYAMFDGVDSPLTQTFGLGLFERANADLLERLEAFIHERGAAVHHEVSPLAGVGLLSLLHTRGYRPIELSSVLFRPVAGGVEVDAPGDAAIRTRRCAAGEEELWARTAARGWDAVPGLGDFMLSIGRVMANRREPLCFVAESDGVPIAAAALSIHQGVAVLAGASTIPEARGRGAQAALLATRLRFAAERGCDLAMMAAEPGSGSQRNAERRGFRIAYTRSKWGV